MMLTVTEIKNNKVYTNSNQVLWGMADKVKVGDTLDMTVDDWGVMVKLVLNGKITLYEEK